jgi:hypothetical protein
VPFVSAVVKKIRAWISRLPGGAKNVFAVPANPRPALFDLTVERAFNPYPRPSCP